MLSRAGQQRTAVSSLMYVVESGRKYSKAKVCFLYSSVSSPLDSSKRFTVTPWQTSPFQHQLDLSGKHSVMLNLLSEDYSFTFPSLSGTHLLRVNGGVMKMSTI